jgi:hypothetical protein
MKFATLLVSLFSVLPVFANTSGSKANPVYKQCTVSLPGGDVAGVCKETGEKHFAIITCEGQLLAFVEPGALPTTYGATCGSKYLGFPGDK